MFKIERAQINNLTFQHKQDKGDEQNTQEQKELNWKHWVERKKINK